MSPTTLGEIVGPFIGIAILIYFRNRRSHRRSSRRDFLRQRAKTQMKKD